MDNTTHLTLNNARNHPVSMRTDIRDDLLACGRQLTDALMAHNLVLGVIAGGSWACGICDGFSDLDLHVFATDITEGDRLIHDCCRMLGGRLDTEATSIHFPLDSPGYLFGDLYLEPGTGTLQEVDEELAQVLMGQRKDDGWLYSLRHGVLLADRNGDMQRLMATLAATQVTRVYADWFTSMALDIPAKLLIHSIRRGDYPYAWHWLMTFYYDCIRILFARAGLFFPGMKRTLIRTLATLPNVPDGFLAFWDEAFTHGITDWAMVPDDILGWARVLKALPSKEVDDVIRLPGSV